MKNRTSIGALLAVIAVVVLLGAGIGGAVAQEDGRPYNATESDSGSAEYDYTLEELKDGGVQAANSPDGVRLVGHQAFWAIHWPADSILADAGNPKDDDWQFLGNGDTVNRNAIYLRTRLLDQDSEDSVVKVAYWQEGTREVKDGNITRTEPYLKDLEIDTKEITFQKGWSAIQEISLRQSPEPRQVTVWIEGQEDRLRWTFTHHTVATAQPAAINSQGDYLYRATMEFVGPVVIGTFVVAFLVKLLLYRAGDGPGWGYPKWIFVLSVGTAIGLFTQFSSVSEVIVHTPRILALLVVAIIGIVMLESNTTNVKQTAFFRPVLGQATSPSGENAVDIIDLEEQEERTIRMPGGARAVIRDGMLPFLARAAGGAAILERTEKLKTRMELTDSPIDEMIWVHPESDEVLDYQPEGWQIKLPQPESRADWAGLAIGGASLLMLTQLASSSFGGVGGMAAFFGALGVLVVRPRNGHATFDPAPAHLRSAWTSMLYMSVEAQDAETIEEARNRLVEQQARSEKDVQEALQEQDRTIMEEMFSTDVDRAGDLIEPLEDPDDSSDTAVADGGEEDE